MITVTLIYEHPYSTPEHPTFTQITGVTLAWARLNMKIMKSGGYKLFRVVHANGALVSDLWNVWNQVEHDEYTTVGGEPFNV